jgi:Ca-activated chloride channel family protein
MSFRDKLRGASLGRLLVFLGAVAAVEESATFLPCVKQVSPIRGWIQGVNAAESNARRVAVSQPLKTKSGLNLPSESSSSSKSGKSLTGLIAMTSTGATLGVCPLRHTAVNASVSGYAARVTVKQTFENTFKEKIEAIYTFPLSDSGSVDSMIMKIGDRTIKGEIKKREEAKNIYDQARSEGRLASLLDQERTNIFTQSVANIEPGKKVEVTLQYVELLPFEDGRFSFVFPTLVGPRFIPGAPIGKSGTGRENDTDTVPDASRITPPVAEEGSHAGHNISIDVDIEAGIPLSNVSSKLHEVRSTNVTANRAHVSLINETAIPNKDFVLTWDVAQNKLQSGYLAYKDNDAKSGYFSVMLVPPKRIKVDQVAPKEMVFLIDCSGSQHGLPLQKAKETMLYILSHMNPQDTFQVIAFSNQQKLLFDKPQPADTAMRAQAKQFIESLTAYGGTWMAPAVEKACAIPADNNRLRIVTFMTDGYVGNDYEIISMIRKLRGTSRWFSFGTGNSVNRTLIDGIANEGGGEADYVLLNSSAEEVGKKFYDRISSPVLTDVKIAFDGLTTKEVFPRVVSDVWAQKPLFFKGRYSEPGKGKIIITGFAAGKPYKETINAIFPALESRNSVLGSVWARAKVDYLMSSDLAGVQNGTMKDELKNEIIATALKHHIMTQFTSFVAVDSAPPTSTGAPKTMTVPVEMPDGVSRETTVGGALHTQNGALRANRQMAVNGLYRKSTGFWSPALASPVVADRCMSAPLAPGCYAGTSSIDAKQAYTKSESTLSYETNAAIGSAPLIKEGAPKKDGADKLKNKLDENLVKLLAQYKAGKVDGNRKLKIKLSLDNCSESTSKQLKKLMLNHALIWNGKLLTGVCTLAQLEAIVQIANVHSAKLVALL